MRELDLKENQRGRLLKITEDVAGRRNTLMIPVEALKEFEACVVRLLDFEGKLKLLGSSPVSLGIRVLCGRIRIAIPADEVSEAGVGSDPI